MVMDSWFRWCFWLFVDVPLNGLTDLWIMIESYVLEGLRRQRHQRNPTNKNYLQEIYDFLMERKRQIIMMQAPPKHRTRPKDTTSHGSSSKHPITTNPTNQTNSISGTSLDSGGSSSFNNSKEGLSISALHSAVFPSQVDGGVGDSEARHGLVWRLFKWISRYSLPRFVRNGGAWLTRNNSISSFVVRGNKRVTISQLMHGLETPMATPEQAKGFLSPEDSSWQNFNTSYSPQTPMSPLSPLSRSSSSFSASWQRDQEEEPYDTAAAKPTFSLTDGADDFNAPDYLEYYVENQVSPSFVYQVWKSRLGLDCIGALQKLESDATVSGARKTLVLDLDETLVHATTVSTRNYDCMMEVLVGNIACLYYVRKRPFLNLFLETVRQWYDLVVFTASVPEYADPVLNWLDDGRNLFSRRLFRDSCVEMEFELVTNLPQPTSVLQESSMSLRSKTNSATGTVTGSLRQSIRNRKTRSSSSASRRSGNNNSLEFGLNQPDLVTEGPSRRVKTYVKDLSVVGNDLGKICLVDNSIVSFELQPENGYLVSSWFDDKNDRVLLDILPFLDALRYVKDVRSILSLRSFGAFAKPAGIVAVQGSS